MTSFYTTCLKEYEPSLLFMRLNLILPQPEVFFLNFAKQRSDIKTTEYKNWYI